MVSAAAHNGDIIGAKNAGLRVASIAQDRTRDRRIRSEEESVDVAAQNLIELAAKLSAGRG
jgi:hypothetical protein